MNTEIKWYLYGKFKGETRFRPIDWNAGRATNRLVYATRFTDEARATLERVDIPANSDIQFEFRAI